MLNLCQALLCLSLQFSNCVSDGDGSSIFLILLEIKYVPHSVWVAEHPCCDEDGASGFVQSHIWLSNEQFTVPEQRWVFLYMGQHSSEMKVACLPVVWCHAFRICIHMPTAYILLLLPGQAAGGICLSVSVLSFPVPLCWLIMKEKCRYATEIFR